MGTVPSTPGNGRSPVEQRFDSLEQTMIRFEGKLETLILSLEHTRESLSGRFAALEALVRQNREDIDAMHDWRREVTGRMSGAAMIVKPIWAVMLVGFSAIVGAIVGSLIGGGST